MTPDKDRDYFPSLFTASSAVGDRMCTVELCKVQVPALRSPHVLPGWIATRVTGLLVFSAGLAVKFRRHSHTWSAAIPRHLSLTALLDFGHLWNHKPTVDAPGAEECRTSYLYEAGSIEELGALVELLKQHLGPAVPSSDPVFKAEMEKLDWYTSDVIPPYQGKNCLRAEIWAIRLHAYETFLMSRGESWSSRHERLLNDGQFEARERVLFKILRIAEGGFNAADRDVHKASKEMNSFYQERARWVKRLLEIGVQDNEHRALLTMELYRAQLKRAQFLEKLGRAKHQRSVMADVQKLLPWLIDELQFAHEHYARQYSTHDNKSWFGRRLVFFSTMLSRYLPLVQEHEMAERYRSEVAELASQGHEAEGWLACWSEESATW